LKMKNISSKQLIPLVLGWITIQSNFSGVNRNLI
jgi:hypothetical protein